VRIPQNSQTAARLGEPVELRGVNLSAQTVEARMIHPLLRDPVTLLATDLTDTGVSVELPPAAPGIPAGLWSVSLELTNTVDAQEVTTSTNSVALAIAPRITSAMPVSVVRDAQGSVQISLSCEPPVIAGQPVFLVIGGRAVPEVRAVAGDPVTGSALSFAVHGAQLGQQVLRLRVGGVDSVLLDRSGDKPQFDASQAVTVTT
jgi:hypothetical protein